MPVWFLITLLFGLYDSKIVHKSVSAERNAAFDNFVVPEYISQQLYGVDGVFGCLLACSDHHNCQTIFYNELDGYCQLNKVVFFFHANWQGAQGMRYYEVYLDGNCPKSIGYIYNKATNLCFKIHDSNPKPWLDAREICKTEGGDLLVLDTMEKYYYIRETIQASPFLVSNMFHVGASDADLEGDWRWLNGVPLSSNSTMWADDEPSNRHNADFAVIRRYLGDVSKIEELFYICEINIPIL